jgi:hypothetical protein
LPRIFEFVSNQARISEFQAVKTYVAENLNPLVWTLLAMVGALSALLGYWADWGAESIIERKFFKILFY